MCISLENLLSADRPLKSCFLFHFQPQVDEPLGSSQFFSAWSRGAGSAIKGQQPAPPTVSANAYALLDTDSDKQRSLGGGGNRPSGKDHYSSKGPSMERNFKQYNDGNVIS